MTEMYKGISVKSIETITGTDPYKTIAIFGDAGNTVLRKTLFAGKRIAIYKNGWQRRLLTEYMHSGQQRCYYQKHDACPGFDKQV